MSPVRLGVVFTAGVTLLLVSLARPVRAAASADGPHVQASSSQAPVAPGDTTVYITRTGTTYHRAGCRSLSKSAIPKTLKEVTGVYAPCKICKPPVLAATAGAVTAAPRVQATTDPGRCQAITKKGTPCTRRAMPGSKYCWQHAR